MGEQHRGSPVARGSAPPKARLGQVRSYDQNPVAVARVGHEDLAVGELPSTNRNA